MHARWTLLTDPELPLAFTVVPLTGHLVRFEAAPAAGTRPGTHWTDRLIGLHPGRRLDHETPPALDAIWLAEPATCTEAERQAAQALRKAIQRYLRWLPLGWCVRLNARRRRPRRIRPARDLAEALPRIAALTANQARGQCLFTALERHTWLRWYGIPSVLCIGVFVPTEEMHAWVEVAGKPLLESPDVLVHYRTALRFG